MKFLWSCARLTALSLGTVIALTACGGAGGGGAKVVPGVSTSSSATTSEAQKASVTAAAQEARAKKWAAQFASASQSTFRRVVHEQSMRLPMDTGASPSPSPNPSSSPSPAPSGCNGNSSSAVTQNPDGSISISEKQYYDDSCAALLYTMTTKISAADPSGKMTGQGTQTNYASDGVTVSEYDVLNMVIYNANPGSGDMVMSVARYANQAAASAPNAVALSTDYFSSVDTSANTESIGAASITQDPSFPGQQLASVSTYTTTYTGGLFQTNQTVKTTGTSTNIIDPVGKLAIAAFPLAAGQYQWTISGGRVVNTTTSNETSTQDATGYLLSYTSTITDQADDMTTTITGNAGGSQYTGVIKQTSSGTVLATFTVDADGNGTITFANNTTEPIENWCWH